MSWCIITCKDYGSSHSIYRPLLIWLCWCQLHNHKQVSWILFGRCWSCNLCFPHQVGGFNSHSTSIACRISLNMWAWQEIAQCQMGDQNGELACQKLFGWPNERENCKQKFSWIAKTNFVGTPNLSPILCPGEIVWIGSLDLFYLYRGGMNLELACSFK